MKISAKPKSLNEPQRTHLGLPVGEINDHYFLLHGPTESRLCKLQQKFGAELGH